MKKKKGKISKIIDAAIKVVGEKGFFRSTIKEIGEEAGVSPGLLYYYFKNKRALFLALLQERSFFSQIPGLLSLEKSAREVLKEVALLLFKALSDSNNQRLLRMIVGELATDHDFRVFFLSHTVIPSLKEWGHFFACKIKSGEIKEADPSFLARTWMGMLFFHSLSLSLLSEQGRLTAEAAASFVTMTFLEGWQNG